MKKLSKLRVVKNLKMIGKMIGKMIVDHDLIEITFFALSDRDLIGDHIFSSDCDLIGIMKMVIGPSSVKS